MLPFTSALGVAGAFVWSPLTVTTTRNLRSRTWPVRAQVMFNAVRQLGAVLGARAWPRS